VFDCLYQLVKDFQTLIVGVIGFAGVIYTLLMSSRLSREQDERSVKHDREVLKTALRAELGLIRKIFSDKAADLEESDAYFPAETHTNIYKNFIAKLGLLSAEEASAVIKAYTLIEEVPARLRLLSSGHDSSYDKHGYIFIKAPHSKTAAGIYKNFLPSIKTALQKLGDN
jgi:hypothetical protein